MGRFLKRLPLGLKQTTFDRLRKYIGQQTGVGTSRQMRSHPFERAARYQKCYGAIECLIAQKAAPQILRREESSSSFAKLQALITEISQGRIAMNCSSFSFVA